ncbi:MAG: response regulator, partial [Bacteroidota bacterium]
MPFPGSAFAYDLFDKSRLIITYSLLITKNSAFGPESLACLFIIGTVYMLEVLLVEDDMLSAVDLQMKLEEIYESVKVVHRVTAREARNYLAENTPDVLLIDVVLETEKAGIQLVERFTENKPAVIFITAFRREDLFQKALDVDPDSFLQKPITADQLRHAIELALARK